MSDTQTMLTKHNIEHEKTSFGFWLYILTDCVLFATLFATYAVLHKASDGGPTTSELFSAPYVLAETLILLTSSFTAGMALLAAKQRRKFYVQLWLAVTFVLGAAFLALEFNEFHEFIAEDNSWQRSAFLSGFFTLVGTHGLHITVGLAWLTALVVKIHRAGLSTANLRRLGLFSVFWHFLDVVWIFIFTVVYMMGIGV